MYGSFPVSKTEAKQSGMERDEFIKTSAEAMNRQMNASLGLGSRLANYEPSPGHGIAARGGTTRMDLALTAAFEQGADTIFVLSDGKPIIYRPDSSPRAHERKC